MEYGNRQEVVQRRGKQTLIRDWDGWVKGRNAKLLEEITMEDRINSSECGGELNLGVDQKKETAMKGIIPRFKN